MNKPYKNSKTRPEKDKTTKWKIDKLYIIVHQDGYSCKFDEKVVCHSLNKPMVWWVMTTSLWWLHLHAVCVDDIFASV